MVVGWQQYKEFCWSMHSWRDAITVLNTDTDLFPPPLLKIPAGPQKYYSSGLPAKLIHFCEEFPFTQIWIFIIKLSINSTTMLQVCLKWIILTDGIQAFVYNLQLYFRSIYYRKNYIINAFHLNATKKNSEKIPFWEVRTYQIGLHFHILHLLLPDKKLKI